MPSSFSRFDLSSLASCPSSPSSQGVAEFKALYQKQTGIELSDQQALTASTHLLHLLFFGMTPLSEERSDLGWANSQQFVPENAL